MAWAAPRLLARLRRRRPAASAGSAHAFLRGRRPRGRRARSRTCSSWATRARSRSSRRRSISGAIVERMRFGAYLAFITLWSLARLRARSRTGSGAAACSRKLGALDFAGGTVVHVNAGRRRARRRARARPAQGLRAPGDPAAQRAVHAARRRAALVRLVRLQRRQRARGERHRGARLRQHACSRRPARCVVWTLLDLRAHAARRPPSAPRPAIVVGLVAITPAAGFVGPDGGARARRILAAFPSYFALLWRARTRLDDSLDVVAAHGLGGTVGALLTGVFAAKAWNGAADGLLFGNPRAARHPGARGAGGARLQRRRDLRAAEGARARDAACKVERAGGGPRPRRESARRGGLRRPTRARSWSCSGETESLAPVPALAASAAEGGRA